MIIFLLANFSQISMDDYQIRASILFQYYQYLDPRRKEIKEFKGITSIIINRNLEYLMSNGSVKYATPYADPKIGEPLGLTKHGENIVEKIMEKVLDKINDKEFKEIRSEKDQVKKSKTFYEKCKKDESTYKTMIEISKILLKELER